MIRKEYNDEKWIFPFVEYYPENSENKKLPLVIQLHGADERGYGKDELDRVDFHGFSELLKILNAELLCLSARQIHSGLQKPNLF